MNAQKMQQTMHFILPFHTISAFFLLFSPVIKNILKDTCFFLANAV